MRSAQLVHASVDVASEDEESTARILGEVFQAPVAIYQDLETGRRQVSVYVPAARLNRSRLRAELIRRLAAVWAVRTGKPGAQIRFRQLKPTDWAESWKRHFKPIEIPGRLLIKPSWSRRTPKGAAKLVVLDPGLSFGTGQHPTTRFCLEQLAAARRDDTRQSFLDIGTGTGILAIAAAKLGYRPVAGFDFDPVAVRIARENAALNRVQGLRLTRQDLARLPRRSAARFDIICANLTHDLLVSERERIINRLNPGGCLLLAGILNPQFKAVANAYRDAGMKCRLRNTESEWTSGVFRFDEKLPRA